MSARTYPENYIDLLVRDPNDAEYGLLLALGEVLPGGWCCDGVRIPPEQLLSHALASAKAGTNRPVTWQGAIRWRTGHGSATIAWLTGESREAWNVRSANGRVKALRGHIFPRLWRRTADHPPQKYQWGELTISDDDVVFVDVPTPPYEAPIFDGRPSLEIDLAADPAFIRQIADIRFALAAWAEIHYGQYVRDDGTNGARYVGRDGAAWLIAGLRGLGEDIMDFKWWEDSLPETELLTLREDVRAHLQALGWRPE